MEMNLNNYKMHGPPENENNASPAAGESLPIRQEKLDPLLADYIMTLADQYPFTQDVSVDERHVIDRLAHFWPELPEWAAQAYEVWGFIDAIVHSMRQEEPTPKARLHIAVAPVPLFPSHLPHPNEPAMIATFDGIEGVVRHCTFSSHKKSAALDLMTIPAGLMVICQMLTGNDPREKPFITQQQILPTACLPRPVLKKLATGAIAAVVQKKSDESIIKRTAIKTLERQGSNQNALEKKHYETAVRIAVDKFNSDKALAESQKDSAIAVAKSTGCAGEIKSIIEKESAFLHMDRLVEREEVTRLAEETSMAEAEITAATGAVPSLSDRPERPDALLTAEDEETMSEASSDVQQQKPATLKKPHPERERFDQLEPED